MTYNVFSGMLNPTQSINIQKGRVWVGILPVPAHQGLPGWRAVKRVDVVLAAVCFVLLTTGLVKLTDLTELTWHYSYYDNMHYIMIPAMPCSLFNPSTLVILVGCDSVGWRQTPPPWPKTCGATPPTAFGLKKFNVILCMQSIKWHKNVSLVKWDKVHSFSVKMHQKPLAAESA